MYKILSFVGPNQAPYDEHWWEEELTRGRLTIDGQFKTIAALKNASAALSISHNVTVTVQAAAIAKLTVTEAINAKTIASQGSVICSLAVPPSSTELSHIPLPQTPINQRRTVADTTTPRFGCH